ncbi:hypothetical protein T440DRAFT_395298 [Plenodomus tracheiphilus IPT5]|uniref:BTB domain-containing protein n=1 Tax=Plenodomus tracheiphilus IPT5 TaxID=1408161 RepID=A0A6A7B9K5_9PLEO|nr:hypothetical protein T440DRAFT_395298 [Plenodomus tracheiphilus IPT5]
MIHENLLIDRASFFSRALSSGWKEVEEGLVRLPEDDPTIFALYGQLLYTGRIPVFERTDEQQDYHWSSTENDAQKLCQSEYTSLAQLYVFAEKMQDVKAKNAVVQAIIEKINHHAKQVTHYSRGRVCFPGPVAITTIYEETASHCPGRQVLIDCYVSYADSDVMDRSDFINSVPREFLFDLARAALVYRSAPAEKLPHSMMDKYFEDETRKCPWGMWPWFRLQWK